MSFYMILLSVIAQNKNFAQSLEGKAAASHTHTASQVTDLSGAAVNYANSAGSANAVAWGNVSGKPGTFPPSAHNQGWDTITGKPGSYPPSDHTHDDRYYTQSAIKSMLRSSNGNGTINTAYLKSSSYATWRLWGQMVFVTFYFEGSTPPGNGAALVTGGLPTPVGNAECCLVSNNANPAFRVRLESNGQLVRFYGGALNNGEIASGTMTYITAESIA